MANFSIQHITLPGPAYYCGPDSGWLANIALAVVYSSTAAAQAVIDAKDMHAQVVSNPLTTTTIADFTSSCIHTSSLTPKTATSTVNGSTVAVNGVTGAGDICAVQEVGTVSGTTPTLNGKMQDSPDGSSWSNIVGATFTQVISTDNIQVIKFTTAQPFVRYVGTVGGTTPSFALAVSVHQHTP